MRCQHLVKAWAQALWVLCPVHIPVLCIMCVVLHEVAMGCSDSRLDMACLLFAVAWFARCFARCPQYRHEQIPDSRAGTYSAALCLRARYSSQSPSARTAFWPEKLPDASQAHSSPQCLAWELHQVQKQNTSALLLKPGRGLAKSAVRRPQGSNAQVGSQGDRRYQC